MVTHGSIVELIWRLRAEGVSVMRDTSLLYPQYNNSW